MMRCVSKGSVGDAKRLRETASRLRAMMKVKDELLARQEELVGLQAEQLTDRARLIDVQAEQIALQAEQLTDRARLIDVQAEQIALQAEQLTNRARLIDVQAEQIAVLEESVARGGGRAGEGRGAGWV